MSKPYADREVWLVLGAAMSLAEVAAQARKPRPSDEMIQIYALLQVAWSAVTQCGGRLRIFCSP